MKFLLVIFVIFIGCYSYSKDIRIGLFEKKPVREITIKYNIGRYDIFTNTKMLGVFQNRSTSIRLKASGDKVKIYKNGVEVDKAVWVRLNKKSDLNSLLLFPHGIEKRYRGNIIAYAKNGKLQVINEVNMDEYVQGVLKGEVGYGYEVSYYTVQAVISRTYALHLHKHKDEGFDLCDHTHCQVYKGINYDNKITEAVKLTSGVVIVDSAVKYLNTLFHSNCGGQTVTTDIVWNKRLKNLESIKDPHCRSMSQANWTKRVSKSSWIRYLSNKLNKSKEYIASKPLDFNQGYRKKYYKVGRQRIKLTEIRSFFRLKSTFFSIHDIGDKIIITGRGYGHGVGLCQEGAIAMSKKGYDYNDILHFYFQNIHLMNINERQYYLLF